MCQQTYNEQMLVSLYVRSHGVFLNCCFAGKRILRAQKSYLVRRESLVVNPN